MYKLPWDMTTLRNKQYDPFYVLRTVSTFASEASSTLRRRFRGSPDKVWLQSSMYPDYYLNTFHYQVVIGSANGTALFKTLRKWCFCLQFLSWHDVQL